MSEKITDRPSDQYLHFSTCPSKCLLAFGKHFLHRWERLPNFHTPPPHMNVLKRCFFDGAYIEKQGMVFWGESNKEEMLFFLFFYYGINIPFIYYLLTLSSMFPHTHSIIFITDYELTVCRFDSNPSGRYGLACVS